ncbi:ATP-dependent RNA helicase dbp6 [Cercospora zeina]
MNGLYKRYIPPKSTWAPQTAPATPKPPPATPKPPPATAKPIAEPESERKRKRERPEEEIAERKAKKLRKKGIDPATVQNVESRQQPQQPKSNAVPGKDSAPKPAAQPTEEEIKATRAVAEARGDFSHVASRKKRHKLEAQARKAGLRVAGKIDAPGQQDSLKESSTTDADVEKASHQPTVDVAVTADHAPVEESPNEAQKSVDAQDAPLESGPQPSKKRRHKLEAVIAGGLYAAPNDDSLEQEGDRRSKKHDNVLGKFKRSAKRSPVPEEPVRDSNKPELETVDRLEIPDAAPADFVLDKESQQPEWLRNPTYVDSRVGKKSWKELKLDPTTCDRLAKLTFEGALPIQQALVPLLMPPAIPGAVYLPGSEKVLPDVVVSAPTGSGKTVSYLLPITEALRRSVSVPSQQRHLSAVIFVPTQELVTQVAAVAEALSKGSKIKVGQSNSKHSLREEQNKLVKQGQRYNPAEYSRYMAIADLGQPQNCPSDDTSPEYAAWLEANQPDPRTEHIIEIMLDPSWPRDFVPTHESLIDIFVATPQRLQDHLEHTQGFSLQKMTWLVLDEADRMLDNQHRSFLELLNRETHRELHVFRDYSGGKPLAEQPPRLRKVVLSATIPSDVKVEYAFQLRSPKLVIERGAEMQADSGVEAYARRANASGELQTAGDHLELPQNLGEFVVPVGDGSEKPLVAIELLKSRLLKEVPLSAAQGCGKASDLATATDSFSNSESDDDGISSDTDSSSNSDSDSDSSSDDQSRGLQINKPSRPASPSAQGPSTSTTPAQPTAPTILIFTSSTESANRLNHLLKSLVPSWKPHITTILKHQPRHTKLQPSDPALVISTDRAGRGLDNFMGRMFTHVIQYDVPRSLTDYVHRVGRTARAGRSGEAWTLLTHKQAGWFKEEIVKSEVLVRSSGVEEVKMARADDTLREAYRVALECMREVVEGGKGRK